MYDVPSTTTTTADCPAYHGRLPSLPSSPRCPPAPGYGRAVRRAGPADEPAGAEGAGFSRPAAAAAAVASSPPGRAGRASREWRQTGSGEARVWPARGARTT